MQISTDLAQLANQVMRDKGLQPEFPTDVLRQLSQIGTVFKGIITGVCDKGTWVRIFQPAIEGKVIKGFEKLNIGDKVSVQLKYVDITKGFIDFGIT